MAVGFRDPVGSGVATVAQDTDGYFAVRRFLQLDVDDQDPLGLRHLAIDWNADAGANANELAYAAYGGVISYVSSNAGSGRGGVVMVNHTLSDGKQYTTVYMHLENIPSSFQIGTAVSRGQLLGDSQGNVPNQPTPPHIHYEVREGHQGFSGLGFGYYGGNTGATLQNSGATNGVDWAEVRLSTGTTVRYLDPVDFTGANRTLPDPPTSRPDLVIQNARIDDTTVNIGQEVRVDWEVRNVGTGAAASSVAGVYMSRNATWDTGDIRVDYNTTTALSAGATDTGEYDTFVIPTAATSGTWYVLVVADEGRLITEGNEANNVWARQITVGGGSTGRADLVVENARIDDTTVRGGQTVRVDWDARNIGTAEAAATDQFIFLSTDRTLSSSDRRLDTNTLSTMSVGERDAEYDSFVIPTGLSTGRYYIGVVADASGDVLESNEANNVAWISFDLI